MRWEDEMRWWYEIKRLDDHMMWWYEMMRWDDELRSRYEMMIWDDVFLVVLGVCWVDFWSFWGVLGGLLEVLEGLGRLLGGSWGVLGASWGRLGPSWVVRVVLSSTRWAEPRHLGRFWDPKGGQDGAKMEPKSDSRWTKIEDKNDVEKRRSWRSSWSRLGSVLGRLECRLGVVEWGFAPAKLRKTTLLNK